MKILDVRGKLCPEPLIITKKAIKNGNVGDSFTVILDNDTACQNLEKYLLEMGVKFNSGTDGGVFKIVFTLGAEPQKEVAIEPFCDVTVVAKSDYVVVLASHSMGQDEDGGSSLGKILMRGFINSLAQQDRLPKTIIMYNSGVLCAAAEADTVDALKELLDVGVDILLCGVCVDYYGIKESMQVGRISNMFEITKILSETSKVIYP